jgi:hypothetical protein
MVFRGSGFLHSFRYFTFWFFDRNHLESIENKKVHLHFWKKVFTFINFTFTFWVLIKKVKIKLSFQ